MLTGQCDLVARFDHIIRWDSRIGPREFGLKLKAMIGGYRQTTSSVSEEPASSIGGLSL